MKYVERAGNSVGPQVEGPTARPFDQTRSSANTNGRTFGPKIEVRLLQVPSPAGWARLWTLITFREVEAPAETSIVPVFVSAGASTSQLRDRA